MRRNQHNNDPGGEHINLKVVAPDGNEVYFKCKMTTPLQKLMHAFCNRQGHQMNSVRFLFDGERLRPDQTPADVRSLPPCRACLRAGRHRSYFRRGRWRWRMATRSTR